MIPSIDFLGKFTKKSLKHKAKSVCFQLLCSIFPEHPQKHSDSSNMKKSIPWNPYYESCFKQIGYLCYDTQKNIYQMAIKPLSQLQRPII